MFTEAATRRASGDLLRQILLDYLQANWAITWPGTDGLTTDDVLNSYPQACAAGKIPDRQELCRRHAELLEEIHSLFTSKGWPASHVRVVPCPALAPQGQGGR